MNLTAITDDEGIAVKHFADSLYLFKCAELKGKRILDIGSGAGFPGMPLLIYDPSLDITMLDSTQKRIDFINESRKMLGLGGSTVCARAEEYAYNVASYLLEYDNPIQNGETIDGVADGQMSQEIQWVCRYENALIQPPRAVLDINMGEYASGRR